MHRKSINPIVAIVIASAVVVGLGTFFIVKQMPHITNDARIQNATAEIRQVTMEDLKNRRYITDCKYSEPYPYPEAYDIPFGYSDEYIKNKDLSDSVKDPAIETAEKFLDALLNTGYREIQASPEAYSNKISEYGMNSLILDGIYPLENDMVYTIEEITEILGDYFIQNRVEQENEFITNTSLVYSDYGSICVRGAIKNIIHYSDDTEIEEEAEHVTLVDISMVEDNNSPTGYSVETMHRLKNGGY